MPILQLADQVEKLLDEAPHDELDLIVQMRSEEPRMAALSRAAGQALTRRRLTLTPREVLPGAFEKNTASAETASTRDLLGKAKTQALTLAKIQKIGHSPLKPLLKQGVIQTAVARMVVPDHKSEKDKPAPPSFWTSRSMPVRLRKDELRELAADTDLKIRSINCNRTLHVPDLVQVAPLKLEDEEVLSSTWGLRKSGVLAAWGVHGARGKGVRIGLLDTGVDASHPALRDGSAGKVKFWEEFGPLGQPLGTQPHDSDEHGTHCAGTLAGGIDAGTGRHIGVAPEAELAVALVLNGKQGGTDAQVLAGIDWCVDNKVDVISMSLGGLVMDAETPPTYSEAILTCVQAGIPVVTAIGNEGHQTTGSPGNDLFALSVGATDPLDRPAGFSGGRTQILRRNDFIDPKFLPLAYSKPELSGPGVGIYSSVPDGKFKSFSGTSMATPHVAGAIALLLSATKIRQMENGERKAFLLQDLIIGSVEDLGESGQDHRYGFGRLDVLRAIDFAIQRGYGK